MSWADIAVLGSVMQSGYRDALQLVALLTHRSMGGSGSAAERVERA